MPANVLPRACRNRRTTARPNARRSRAQHLGARRHWNSKTPQRRRWSSRPAPDGGVRLDLPLRSTSRDCLPQPESRSCPVPRYSILSSAPTFRLAYRNFKTYETMVTNQSVEATPASPASAGTRFGGPEYLQHLPAGHLRAGRRRPSLDWEASRWTRRRHCPGLQRC